MLVRMLGISLTLRCIFSHSAEPPNWTDLPAADSSQLSRGSYGPHMTSLFESYGIFDGGTAWQLSGMMHTA